MQSKRSRSRGCSGAPCFARYRGDAHNTRRLGAKGRAQLAGAVDKIRASLPPGYRLEDGGAVEQSAKGQRSVLAVLPVMFILMLLILMIQLQSVQKLGMVMLTAPLGLIGVTLALLLSH